MGQRGASHSVTLAHMHSLQILVALLFCVGPWSDAFKAAGCTEMETQRYVVRLRQKVDEGLALEGGSAK